MKVGIGDEWFRKRFGREQAYEVICRHGYDCVDYQNFVSTETPMFQERKNEFDAIVREEQKMISSFGLEIFQVHAPWRWPTRDRKAEDRAERFEKMCMAIRGTALLGSRFFVIHPLLPWWDLVGDDQQLFDINFDFMTRLCDVAEKNGVVLCFENMPMPAVSLATPAACLEFARKINSPWFKICLDTGHCSCCDVDPADAVRMLGSDMLKTLHVHDNNGRHDLHWVPYTGVIDWDAFAGALQEIGYDGCLNVECVPPKKFPDDIFDIQNRSLYLSACKLAGR